MSWGGKRGKKRHPESNTQHCKLTLGWKLDFSSSLTFLPSKVSHFQCQGIFTFATTAERGKKQGRKLKPKRIWSWKGASRLETQPRVGVCSNLELQIFTADWESSPANIQLDEKRDYILSSLSRLHLELIEMKAANLILISIQSHKLPLKCKTYLLICKYCEVSLSSCWLAV